MNVWLLLIPFAAPIAAGAAYGGWSWWLPRHRLNRIFRDCKRVRLARLAAERALLALVPS